MKNLFKKRFSRWLSYTFIFSGLWLFAPGMLERHFIYFPTEDQLATPVEFGLDFETVSFPAEDGVVLDGWYIQGDRDAPVVLFCMGNYGNKSYRLDNLAMLNRLGLSVFIFDYRGYGNSGGQPGEEGTYQDARGAVAWLLAHGYQLEQIIFFGRSLGAAVALQAAIETPPAALILETPFTSIAAMGKTHYSLLYFLLGWLIEADYDNLDKISKLNSPLLIFHGDQDKICPPQMVRQLYAKASHPKQLVWIEGANHNNTLAKGGSEYWSKWMGFLSTYAGYHSRPQAFQKAQEKDL